MCRGLSFLCLLLCFSASAKADSITIGQLQYLGTENGVSGFKVTIDTTGITVQTLPFASVVLSVKTVTQDAGPMTSPMVLLFTGGPGRTLPACPCSAVILKLSFLSSNQEFTFTLADGRTFTTRSIRIFNLHALGGQRLRPGDVMPITLISVPELGTLLLVGTGFIMIGRKLSGSKRVRQKLPLEIR
jgi:hypothetical protein